MSVLTDSLGRYRFDGTASLSGPGRMAPPRAVPWMDFENLWGPDGRWLGGRPGKAGMPAFTMAAPTETAIAAPVTSGKAAGSAGPGLAKSSAAGNLEVTARGYLDTSAAVAENAGTLDMALARDTRRQMWIWGNTVATAAYERDSLFGFARRKGIGTLYLDCGGIIGNDKDVLGRFLDSAHARGLAVELLFGAPEWALAKNHAIPVGLARKAVALADSLRKLGRSAPNSIQMDVEPHSLAEWTGDPNGTYNQFIDMFVEIAAALKGSGIGITACIPRWFDERMVLRNDRTRPLSDWLADATDRLTLMDYVDNANGIIAGAAHEIAYADSTGKEVVVGVETMPGLDPPSVSFAEEGEAAMNAALEQTTAQYQARPGFFGVAIHHWGTYPAMKP